MNSLGRLHQQQQQQAQQQQAQQQQAHSHGFAGEVGQGISFGNVGVIHNQFSGPHQFTTSSVFPPTAPPHTLVTATAPTAPAPAPAPAPTQQNINISDQLYLILTIFYKSTLNDKLNDYNDNINKYYGMRTIPEGGFKNGEEWSQLVMEKIKNCMMDIIYIVPSLFTEKGLFDQDGQMVDLFNPENFNDIEFNFLQIIAEFVERTASFVSNSSFIPIERLNLVTNTYNSILNLENNIDKNNRIDWELYFPDTENLPYPVQEGDTDADPLPYPVVYNSFVQDFNKFASMETKTELIQNKEFKEVWENYIMGEGDISISAWNGFLNKDVEGNIVWNSSEIPKEPVLPISKTQLYISGLNVGFGNFGLDPSNTGEEPARIVCEDTPNPNHTRGWNYLFGKISNQESTVPMPRHTKFENYLIWEGITRQDTSCFFNDNYDNMMRLCINQIKTCIELQSVLLKFRVMTSL